MDTKAEAILDQALDLPVDARAEMAHRLIESLREGSDEDAASAWKGEVQRRLAELDSGMVCAEPWPTLRARLRDRVAGGSA